MQASSSGQNLMISVKILKGSGFVKSLITEGSFQCSVLLFGETKQGKSVPAIEAPTFNDSFVFTLKNIDLQKYVKLNSPLHIVLMRITPQDQHKIVIGSRKVEWRHILYARQMDYDVQFFGPNFKQKGALCSLKVVISFAVPLKKSQLVQQHAVTHQLTQELKLASTGKKVFDEFASQFWDSLKVQPKLHKKHLIQIFVETEDRELFEYRPVTSLVLPLQPSRLLETPFHVLRFVSLLPLDRETEFTFHTFHSIIAAKKGNICDRALLLCSLLLGFGLNAYVVIGTASDTDHLWVLTQNEDGLEQIFWESLTGERYSMHDPVVLKTYQTANCVFNNKEFYANIQADDRVGRTSLDFKDSKSWKAIPKEKLELLLPWNIQMSFREPSANSKELEENLENDLKTALKAHRKGNTVLYDEQVETAVQMAVAAYEFERLYGKTVGENEFKDAVSRATPKGHIFKAFPFQMRNVDPKQAFCTILESEVKYTELENL